MKPWALGLGLGLLAGVALLAADAVAWTEDDLQGARRLLEKKLEQRHAAAAKAKAESEARAKAEAEAKTLLARKQVRDGIAQGMVTIPDDPFQMGCSPGDNQCSDSERPAHQVKVPSFRMGKFEVTQAQWQAVMDANPSRFKGDDRPVENVSWDDAQTFLKRLNAGGQGQPYRLPTEAEWEYAARAGQPTPYWWGKDIGKGNANCYDCGSQWDNKETAPVGSFKANRFGLYDTMGNVWEWVQDCYHDSYTGAPSDGSEWRENNCTAGRVLRGGSWDLNASTARVSNRLRNNPASRTEYFGLRLAQDL